MKPFWVTFYSYKGGVGRSLALANLATLLVKKGRRVVLVDFDLEAPGLDSFDEFKAAQGKPGVVEYTARFMEAQMAPPITEYVHPCDLHVPLRGKLWIMPAGRKDRAYNQLRARIDWSELYEQGLGEPFVENWKAAIADEFKPDYVFVDSRTGLTDVGGICTLQLPDLVVMLFALNTQNIDGIAAVARAIRESDAPRVPQLRFVATPVPNLPADQRGPLTERFADATEKLGVKIPSRIRYYSPAALAERLFVLSESEVPVNLVQDYEELLGHLTQANRSGLDYIEKQVEAAVELSDRKKALRLRTLTERLYSDRAEGLYVLSEIERLCGHQEKAESLAWDALKRDPAFQAPFEWLWSVLRIHGAHERAVELCDLALCGRNRMEVAEVVDILDNKGAACMSAGLSKQALQAYEEASGVRGGEEATPLTLLARRFNIAEARRRATQTINAQEWGTILEMYPKAHQSASADTPLQANHMQAIHIPLALLGELDEAKDALNKARMTAERAGEIEDIFCVKTYTEITAKDFLKINEEMLAALDKGRLWDGMKLPSPQAKTTRHRLESKQS